MSKQTIGIGSAANDGTGDPLRTAFNKANLNFTELYTGLGGLLAKSAVAASITGTLTETVLGTITAPGSTIGLNGQFRVTAYWSCTSSANVKNMRVRVGGLAGSVAFSVAPTTVASLKSDTVIANRNSASSQFLITVCARGTDGLVTTTASTPITVDTTASQDIVLTGQLTNTGETITLEGYTVEYMN